MIKKINNENVRFVNYENKYTLTIKGKNNKIIKVEKTTTCNLITNLNIDNYNDDKIKHIYIQINGSPPKMVTWLCQEC